jgi:hypothetical protein
MVIIEQTQGTRTFDRNSSDLLLLMQNAESNSGPNPSIYNPVAGKKNNLPSIDERKHSSTLQPNSTLHPSTDLSQNCRFTNEALREPMCEVNFQRTLTGGWLVNKHKEL